VQSTVDQELDLYAIGRVILKRWKLIILLPLVAALVSLLISLYVITPQYRASTTLIITRPADTEQVLFRDIQVSRQLAATYREIVHSRRVMMVAIANRSLPYSVEDLRDRVDVENVRDTELITIDVTDPDPQLARDIANEVARAFMSQIIEIMRVENVSVVDEAATPVRPVSPRVELNTVVAFVVGLMAAAGLAFLLEYIDRTVKDPAEAQRQLEIPVIGVIPLDDKRKLFSLNDPRSQASEAFRTLRTNLHYSGIDRQLRCLLVTGANPACGKSTVAANLGVTLAQAGANVLLVDADLRRPTLHTIFGLENQMGLSDLIIRDDLYFEDTVLKSKNKRLNLLPSGSIPPFPAEMLASERMKGLVASFAVQYDYVIFDSPPTNAVTDAAVLSKLVDGTLFVLDYGRVRWDEARAGLENLQKVQAYLLGAVINAVPQGEAYGSNYQYYYTPIQTEEDPG